VNVNHLGVLAELVADFGQHLAVRGKR